MARHASQNLAPEEVEFLRRLLEMHRRAFVPLKWFIFVVAVVFWALSRPSNWPPPTDVFALFSSYFLVAAAETYLVWVSRPHLRQIRPLCVVSYLLDIVFVTLLVWLDSVRYAGPSAGPTDFYMLYFIVILRSFALFRTARATLAANTLIGFLFVVTLLWQDPSLPTYSWRNNLIRVVFFWVVAFMTSMIAALVNRQKAELMEVREKLLRSENMVLLGQLAAGVAHEMNNPLGIISAYAEYLAKNAPQEDPHHEDYRAIHREALRCKAIVGELLDLARAGEAQRVAVDAMELIDHVLTLMGGASEGGRVVVANERPGEPLPKLVGDPRRLGQAILNVLLDVRLEAERCGRGIRLRYELESEPPRLAILVETVESAQAPRQEGLTVSSEDGSRGFGLTVAERIVAEHGGELVREKAADGVRVRIVLPVEPTKKGSSSRWRRVG